MNRVLTLLLCFAVCGGAIHFGQDFFLFQETPIAQSAQSWGILESVFILLRENQSAEDLERDFAALYRHSERKREVIERFIAGAIDLDEASLAFKELIAARRQKAGVYSYFPKLSEDQVVDSLVINWASDYLIHEKERREHFLAEVFERYGHRYVDLGKEIEPGLRMPK